MVGGRRLEPKIPQQKEQGAAVPGQGCWLGYLRSFAAAPERWEGKDLFPYGFPDAHGVCVCVVFLLQKGRLGPTPESWLGNRRDCWISDLHEMSCGPQLHP